MLQKMSETLSPRLPSRILSSSIPPNHHFIHLHHNRDHPHHFPRNSSLRQYEEASSGTSQPDQPAPAVPTLPTLQLPTQPASQPPPLQRKPSNSQDAQLAEQFASMAFSSSYTSTSRPPPPTPPPKPTSSYTEPAPVGWGGVYDSMTPAQAVYGPPVNLNPSPPALMVTQVDYALSETIRPWARTCIFSC